jgi:hypothetical protein
MPLVQWIMQNLGMGGPIPAGAVAGGTASVQLVSSIVEPAEGVICGGTAIVQVVTAMGGVVCGGSATVEVTNIGFGVVAGGDAVISPKPCRRKVKFVIGDTIYDSCNKPWVVIGFVSTPNETKYTVSNNISQKQLYEKEMFSRPTHVLPKIPSFASDPFVPNQTVQCRKQVKFVPGNTVYDICNKPWVVTSFVISNYNEVKYTVTNNVTQKVFAESEIFNQPIYSAPTNNFENHYGKKQQMTSLQYMQMQADYISQKIESLTR